MEELDRQAIIRVKQRLARLFEPNPWIYWPDLLVSAALGWTAFVGSLVVSSALASAACLFVSVFALYRALAFTHELEHRANELRGFRAAWHLLIGIPFCLPHFQYREVHRIHHSTRYYGTPEDPEYLPFVAEGSFKHPIRFLLLGLVFPFMVATRYLVISPLALVSPRVRTWSDTKASSFVMKLDYERALPGAREMTLWRWEEYTTTLVAWSLVLLVAFGPLPALLLAHWYLVMAGIMLVNGVRALAATHVYASTGALLSFEDHIGDSINVERRSILNALVCPLGLSLHATHHIFPTLPYYGLRRAHEALMAERRGEGSPLQFYADAQWSHVVTAIARLIRLTRAGTPATSSREPGTPVAATPEF
jgi:fatty acid desaturase